MIVCDTTVLSYLVPLGLAEHLRLRYGSIAIPEAVRRELSHPKTPEPVRAWIADPPFWVQILPSEPLVGIDLDPGEREAIPLAERLGVRLLLDDRAARDVARERGVDVIGTIGFLALEAEEGRLDYDEIVDQLSRAGFRSHPDLIAALRPRR